MHQISLIYKHFLSCSGISTDTRSIEKDQMFFCLKGENFNGNKFAQKALEAGASYVIIDEEAYLTDERMILVKDVLKSLQQLANYHRKEFSIPILGITGTNGKTTSKELIHAVLSRKYKTHATKGNFNNHIGVPITLLTMPLDTEFAIIEMGANHQGEIKTLCEIAEPNLGLITSIGKAHLEGFGSIEGVIKTKNELYQSIIKKEGMLFVNHDNNLLMELSDRAHRKTYGKSIKADVHGTSYITNSLVGVKWENESINSQLFGSYNFENIMAAICIGKYSDVAPMDISKALSTYKPANQRSQLMETANNKVIMDAYNANPTSVSAALESFIQSDADNKVVILGDMLELGADSEYEHQAIIEKARAMNSELTIFVGEEFKKASKNPNNLTFINKLEAIAYLKENPLKDSLILLKGSRGIALESLLEVL